MKLSSLIYAFATFMAALAADAEDNKDLAPSPLVTIKVALQCRGDDCKTPPSTPILTQINDNVLNKTTPDNYPPNSDEMQFAGRTIGEITLNKTLAGTKDFRVDGNHLFKGNDQANHPGELQNQVYNLACTVALPSKPQREDMRKEVYEFDLQNKMEGGMWDLLEGDGIRVKCWKLLPSRTLETDGWPRVDGNLTKPAFELKIGSRCDGDPDKKVEDRVKECKKNNQTLPFISYMNNGVINVTSSVDIDSDLGGEPRATAGDMIQVAHLDFDHPTLDNTTQLPLPEIFTMSNWEGEGQKTYDCEIRILNKPVLETDLIQVGQLHSMGYFDINFDEPGGGFGYCYETILPA